MNAFERSALVIAEDVLLTEAKRLREAHFVEGRIPQWTDDASSDRHHQAVAAYLELRRVWRLS